MVTSFLGTSMQWRSSRTIQSMGALFQVPSLSQTSSTTLSEQTQRPVSEDYSGYCPGCRATHVRSSSRIDAQTTPAVHSFTGATWSSVESRARTGDVVSPLPGDFWYRGQCLSHAVCTLDSKRRRHCTTTSKDQTEQAVAPGTVPGIVIKQLATPVASCWKPTYKHTGNVHRKFPQVGKRKLRTPMI